ncbi:hypothetical protein JHK85_004609 [Glycine max]|nr:hypothetical protein JHK85_004609 [Glycine max]
MALCVPTATVTLPFKCIIDSHSSKPNTLFSSSPKKIEHHPHLNLILQVQVADSGKWGNMVSLFPGFITKGSDVLKLNVELYEAIAPLDRGKPRVAAKVLTDERKRRESKGEKKGARKTR